jgi:hypothetical protein
MLSDHTLYNVETLVVGRCSTALRDELIACQHPTEDYGESVHMDGDYVFDASLDDSMTPSTRGLLNELVDSFPNTHLFIFNP